MGKSTAKSCTLHVRSLFQHPGRLRKNHFGTAELRWSACVPATNAVAAGRQGRIPAGCSKRLSSKAAGESKPEAYPQGYVEDFDEPRTKLEDFFSILLGELVLCHAVPQCIAGNLEEPACFGNIAACALQRFL